MCATGRRAVPLRPGLWWRAVVRAWARASQDDPPGMPPAAFATVRLEAGDAGWFVDADGLHRSFPFVWSFSPSDATARPNVRRRPASQSGTVSRRRGEGRCDQREPRHDHPIRARTRPARPGPGRDHQRATSADQPRLPAAGIPGRSRRRRPGNLRPVVCPHRAPARRHRIPRRLADHGHQPHLPRPAPLGPRPPRALRRPVDPRAAARTHRVDQQPPRRPGRPRRPHHPR